MHGLFFGRVAPSSQRAPGDHRAGAGRRPPADPIHPAADAAMLAEELPNAEFVRARSILEWRVRPERLNRAAADFALGCWRTPRRARRTSR